MGLFDPPVDKVSPEQLQQLKAWVSEQLALEEEIPVSISQLACTEPGCPPLETVISVMSKPPQTYKIHRPAAEITHADVLRVFSSR